MQKYHEGSISQGLVEGLEAGLRVCIGTRDDMTKTAQNVHNALICEAIQASGLDRETVEKRLAFKAKYEGKLTWFRPVNRGWNKGGVGILQKVDARLAVATVSVRLRDQEKKVVSTEMQEVPIGETVFEESCEHYTRLIEGAEKDHAALLKQQAKFALLASNCLKRAEDVKERIEQLRKKRNRGNRAPWARPQVRTTAVVSN